MYSSHAQNVAAYYATLLYTMVRRCEVDAWHPCFMPSAQLPYDQR
jgi:hypothetical protein